MPTYGFTLKDITPWVSFDTGRDTPEADMRRAIEYMGEVIADHRDEFTADDRAAFANKRNQFMVDYEAFKQGSDEAAQYLHDGYVDIENGFGGRFSAEFHGESNTFFIWDGPSEPDDSDYVVTELRSGWGAMDRVYKTMAGAIVDVFEYMDTDGFYPNVWVLLDSGEYKLVIRTEGWGQ